MNATLTQSQLQGSGGSLVGFVSGGFFHVTQISVPQSLLSEPAGNLGQTYQQFIDGVVIWGGFSGPYISENGIHTGTIHPGQVQYTTAYDANILSQAGHTVLFKNMNINTGNKVAATQANVKANTLLTYIATGEMWWVLKTS